MIDYVVSFTSVQQNILCSEVFVYCVVREVGLYRSGTGSISVLCRGQVKEVFESV